jgi:hypothetical protein
MAAILLLGCSTTPPRPASRFPRQFNVPGTETEAGAIKLCKESLSKYATAENVENCVSWFGFDIIGKGK